LRVVLDTDRKLSPDYGIFQGGPPTLLVCAADAGGAQYHGQAEVLRLAPAEKAPARRGPPTESE
jgi:hypothetical protein